MPLEDRDAAIIALGLLGLGLGIGALIGRQVTGVRVERGPGGEIIGLVSGPPAAVTPPAVTLPAEQAAVTPPSPTSPAVTGLTRPQGYP